MLSSFPPWSNRSFITSDRHRNLVKKMLYLSCLKETNIQASNPYHLFVQWRALSSCFHVCNSNLVHKSDAIYNRRFGRDCIIWFPLTYSWTVQQLLVCTTDYDWVLLHTFFCGIQLSLMWCSAASSISLAFHLCQIGLQTCQQVSTGLNVKTIASISLACLDSVPVHSN